MALDRFHRQPFDALVVDCGTAGREGIDVFEKVIAEAERQQRRCAGILLLEENQAEWAETLPAHQKVAVMVRPVTLKALHHQLCELVPLAKAGAR